MTFGPDFIEVKGERRRAGTLQVLLFSPIIVLGVLWELSAQWFNAGRAFVREFM
jgi:hypothetical protein